MHLHILGVCGTFMSGIALLARELGHEVTGSDLGIYPPMSDQLQAAGIPVIQGYDTAQLEAGPDQIIIGNSLSRGNDCVEFILNNRLPYTSGPQWLAANVLQDRFVLAVAGTHGKTTTTSMLAWILERSGGEPGFSIGGIAENFGISARLGAGRYFVIEADEYDSAFFDKRSKFIHYHPRILVIGNIEYDHADIFPDLGAIEHQFHHLVRTVPANGRLIVNAEDAVIPRVLEQGCWTPAVDFGIDGGWWRATALATDYSEFEVGCDGKPAGKVKWDLIGRHNAMNALAAIAAAAQEGIEPDTACRALAGFRSVKRRLQKLAEVRGISVYDDFAHHPTAIRSTLDGLRARVGSQRIIAVVEPRSNTMKLGVHGDNLPRSLLTADMGFIYRSEGATIDYTALTQGYGSRLQTCASTAGLIQSLVRLARSGDHIVIMSNGGFEGIHQRLIRRLQEAS